jgi:hypothetical protein
MAEPDSERLWRLSEQAEERAAMARTNRQDETADRLWTRAAMLKDQARDAEAAGR